jgi:hypothetical protein
VPDSTPRGAPFGDLTGEQSIYHFGYDHFRLADFCDGYIIQGPLADYRGVTPIPGFIDETNLSPCAAGRTEPEGAESERAAVHGGDRLRCGYAAAVSTADESGAGILM